VSIEINDNTVLATCLAAVNSDVAVKPEIGSTGSSADDKLVRTSGPVNWNE